MKRARACLLLVAVLSGLAACGLDIVGSLEGPTDAGSDAAVDGVDAAPDAERTDDGASDGEADADAHADADADAADEGVGADGGDGATCLAPAEGILGWWSGDDDLHDRVGGHDGASGTQAAAQTVGFTTGEVGDAFDLKGTSYVQIPNATSLQVTTAITVEAWIYADGLGGRIIDKCTAGQSDGFLFDTFGSNLRLIIGTGILASANALPMNRFTHVAGTWDGTTARLYVDGVLTDTKALSGPLPSNSFDVRLGADSSGNSRFDGRLDEVALYGRALEDNEIAAIAAAGAKGRCKP